MENPIRLKSPSTVIYLTAVPFVIFTLLMLIIRSEDIQLFLTFLLASYSVIFTSYIGGTWWGLFAIRNRNETVIQPLLRPLLFCLVPSILAWVALIIHSPIFTLVALAVIQAAQVYVLFKLRQENLLPEKLIPLKFHPLYISIPCLILSALIFLFNQ